MAAVAIVVATVVVVGQVCLFVVVVAVAVFAPYAFFLSVFQRLLRSRFDFLSILSSHFAAWRRVPAAKVIRRTFRIAALATK